MLPTGRKNQRKSNMWGDQHTVLRFFRLRGHDYGNVASRNLRDKGFHIRYDLPDLDAYGRRVGAEPQRHTARQDRLAKRRREQRELVVPAISRDGMRLSTAITCAVVMAVLLGGISLWDYAARVGTCNKLIAENQVKLEDARAQVTDLEEELAVAKADINVGYRAVGLGMISTKSTSKIRLYAPEDAVMGAPETNNGLRTSQLAAITGDQ